jgi:hypothetical protein
LTSAGLLHVNAPATPAPVSLPAGIAVSSAPHIFSAALPAVGTISELRASGRELRGPTAPSRPRADGGSAGREEAEAESALREAATRDLGRSSTPEAEKGRDSEKENGLSAAPAVSLNPARPTAVFALSGVEHGHADAPRNPRLHTQAAGKPPGTEENPGFAGPAGIARSMRALQPKPAFIVAPKRRDNSALQLAPVDFVRAGTGRVPPFSGPPPGDHDGGDGFDRNAALGVRYNF